MKIACVIDKILISGGAERVMCELSNALATRGHEVHLITRTRSSGETYFINDKVILKDTFVNCRIPGLRNVIRNIKLHNLLKSNNYDVVVSFMTNMNVQTILAAVGTGVPVVVSERVDPRVYKGKPVGFLRSLIYPLSQGFVFQTDDAKAFFSEKIQWRSEVIPNPILASIPQKESYEKTNRIVAIGRITKQKNYTLMLSAFAKFKKNNPNYILEIYGEGDSLEELQKLIAALGIEDSVKFMGQRKDIHNCIKDADMYIMTSDYEGMSNALAEAMVVGLPCVATNCSGGGAAFLIDDNINGKLVECGDEKAIANALDSFAKSEDLRRITGEQAKKLSDKLNRDRVFGMWENYLEKVANKSK